MSAARAVLIWAVVIAACVIPPALAALSPLLQWRSPVYIIAGFAGTLGMVLMLLQPLLAAAGLPGVPLARARLWHRITGTLLVGLVVLHVGGLWLTSPPDVVDALTFRSPTAFSDWGVIAMWALFAAAALAALRRRMGIRPRVWRRAHTGLVALAVAGTCLHALLIDGTMEDISKALLAAALSAVTALVILRLGAWRSGVRTSRR